MSVLNVSGSFQQAEALANFTFIQMNPVRKVGNVLVATTQLGKKALSFMYFHSPLNVKCIIS